MLVNKIHKCRPKDSTKRKKKVFVNIDDSKHTFFCFSSLSERLFFSTKHLCKMFVWKRTWSKSFKQRYVCSGPYGYSDGRCMVALYGIHKMSDFDTVIGFDKKARIKNWNDFILKYFKDKKRKKEKAMLLFQIMHQLFDKFRYMFIGLLRKCGGLYDFGFQSYQLTGVNKCRKSRKFE